MDNARVARELVKVSQLITASRTRSMSKYKEGKIIGNGMRMRWGRFFLLLEELPTKGKKKLKLFDVSIWNGADDSYFNMPNLLKEANISKSSSYDRAKKSLEDAAEVLIEAAMGRGYDATPNWIGLSEEAVHYLNVNPEDALPMDVKAKDFSIISEWTKFEWKTYDSEPHSMDPSYSVIESSSPASARKLYKILKSNPTALSGVNSYDFTKWLDKNGIKYKQWSSQWR